MRTYRIPLVYLFFILFLVILYAFILMYAFLLHHILGLFFIVRDSTLYDINGTLPPLFYLHLAQSLPILLDVSKFAKPIE